MDNILSRARGRNSLIGISVALASALALAGCNSGSELTTADEFQRSEAQSVQKIQQDLAKEKKVQIWEITPEDIQKDPRSKDLDLAGEPGKMAIERALATDIEGLAVAPKLSGYKKVDFSDKSSKVLNYSAPKVNTAGGQPEFVPLSEAFGKAAVQVMKLRIVRTPPTPPVEKGKPAPPPPAPTTDEIYYGPIDKEVAQKQIDMAKSSNMKVDVIQTWPVSFYANDKGRLVAVVENFPFPQRLNGMQNLTYYREDAKIINELFKKRQTDQKARMPAPANMPLATTSKPKTVS